MCAAWLVYLLVSWFSMTLFLFVVARDGFQGGIQAVAQGHFSTEDVSCDWWSNLQPLRCTIWHVSVSQNSQPASQSVKSSRAVVVATNSGAESSESSLVCLLTEDALSLLSALLPSSFLFASLYLLPPATALFWCGLFSVSPFLPLFFCTWSYFWTEEAIFVSC